MGKQQYKIAPISTTETADSGNDFNQKLLNKGYSQDEINSMGRNYQNVAQEKMPEINLGVGNEQYVPPVYKNGGLSQPAIQDFAESIYNSVVGTVEGLAELPATIAIAAGSEDKFWTNWMDGVSNWADSAKATLSDEANKPLTDDWSNINAWSASIGQGLGFIGSMLTGGGIAAKGASLIGKTGSSLNRARQFGSFVSSTVSMTPDLYKQGVESGLSPANAARMALVISSIVSLTEGAALEYMGKAISKPVVTKAAKEAFDETLVQISKKKMLTAGDFDEAIKSTSMRLGDKMKAHLSKGFEGASVESTQEFSQTYIEEGMKQLYDTYVATNKKKGEGAYGADVMSWDTFNNAVAGGMVGGLIGGGLTMGGSLMSGAKGETLFSYVNNSLQTGDFDEKMKELGQKVSALNQQGKLGNDPKQIEEHVVKIKEFIDRTKGLDIPSSAAKYQLFQMMDVEKQMSDQLLEKFSVTDETHPVVAKAYKKNIKLAEQVSGYLNADMQKIIDDKLPVTKNREAFETTLGKYIGLYKTVMNGTATQEDIDAAIPKISYVAKEQLKETKKAEKTKETEEAKAESSVSYESNSIKPVENEKMGTITDEEIAAWTNDKTVSDERLKDIVTKITSGEKLTDEERAISMDDSVTKRKLDIIQNSNLGQEKYNKENPNKNGIQESSPKKMGAYKGGEKAVGRTSESSGMGQVEQGEKTAGKSKKEVAVKKFAPKLTERQAKINALHAKVKSYNDLPNGRLGKTKTEGLKLKNEILNEVREMRDDNIQIEESGKNRKLILQNGSGNKIRPVQAHSSNRAEAEKHTPLNKREAKTQEVFNAMNENGIHTFPVILGTDGKRMSKAQLRSAVDDVVNGVKSNGAENLLNSLDEAIAKNEFNYSDAGQKGSAPLDAVLESMKNPAYNEDYQDLSPEDEFVLADEYTAWFNGLSEKEKAKELKYLNKEYGNPETFNGSTEGNENASNQTTSGITEEKAKEQRDKSSVQNTRKLISENPALYDKIKQHFQSVFPTLPVQEIDNLLWTYGAEVLARISKEGIQINKDSAFQNSLIHEYAHAYVDAVGMDSPLIKLGLEQIKGTGFMDWAKENYPEMTEDEQAVEALVEAISMDSLDKLKTKFEGTALDKFLLWAKTFWSKVKLMLNLNTADDIVSIIANEMNQAKNVENKTQNMPVRDQRSAKETYTRLKDSDTVDVSGFGFNQEELKPLSNKQVERILWEKIAPNPDKGFYKVSTNFARTVFQSMLTSLHVHVDTNDRNNEYSSVSGLSLGDLERAGHVLDSMKNTNAITSYLEGKITRDMLTDDQALALDIIVRAYQRTEYKKKIDQSIFTTEGKVIPIEEADAKVREEITLTEKRKEELYKKVPKKLRKIFEATEKALGYMRTPRLDAKWISGSSESFLSKVFYDSLNAADSKFKDIIIGFNNLLGFIWH